MPLSYYLILSAILFTTGVVGVLTKRNAIMIFMCIELMMNAANLTLVAFSAFLDNPVGQLLVFFVIAVAAAESSVGLAIIIAVFRNKLGLNVNEINIMKW